MGLICQFFDGIRLNKHFTSSLEQVGLSALELCSSSNPLVERQAFMLILSFILDLVNHLREIHPCPWLSISVYTPLDFHSFNYLILALSSPLLFWVSRTSSICFSSGIKDIVTFGCPRELILGSLFVSDSLFMLCQLCILSMLINFSEPFVNLIFQQFG